MKTVGRMHLGLALVVLMCVTVLAGANENAQQHASPNALDLVPYPSALRDRDSLPGEAIPWFGTLTIAEDEWCHYAIGLASRIGRESKDAEGGPGKSGEDFHGSGALRISLAIEDQPVHLNRTGQVVHTVAYDPETGEPLTAWFQSNEFWAVFPPGTFEPGTYDVVLDIDMSRDPKFPVTITSTLIVQPAG